YQHEPAATSAEPNNQTQLTRWNFGLTYRATRRADVSLGVERGNRLLLGISLHTQLNEAYTPKVSDPARVPYALRPPKGPDWTSASQEIARQTGWQVGKVEQIGRDLRVTVLDADGTYVGERVDRAAAVLNRDAPAEIDR